MPTHTAADGTALHYTDFGTGAPVLLVHGWSLSSSMWEYQVQALLAAGYRCITPDRRGHGRSDVPGTGYDLDTLAEDLRGLLEHLDLRGVTLVAHSMGTAEITRMLARPGGGEPGRVARALYLAPITPHLAGALGEDFLPGWFARLRADRPAWFTDAAPGYFATGGSGGSGGLVSPAVVADGIRQILATPLAVQIACIRAFAPVDVTEDLRRVDVPVLVVHGTADESAPLPITGAPTADLIPGARLVVLEGAPHGLYATHQDAVNREILAFAAS